MKRFLLVLLTLAMFCPVFADEKKKTEEDTTVRFVYVLENSKPSSSTNRAPAKCPVECYYYTLADAVELSFAQDLGKVYVSLENQTSGEVRDYSCDSAFGLLRMPVSQNSCYILGITTESGRSFRASFLTISPEYCD